MDIRDAGVTPPVARHWLNARLVVLVALGVAGIALLLTVANPGGFLARLAREQEHLHGVVAGLGVFAPFAFVAAYFGAMLLIWIPAALCSITGGFFFGPLWGSVLSLIGCTAGGLGVYELARSGIHNPKAVTGPLMRRLQEGFRRDELTYVTALRFMPFMPFGLVHIAAGALNVSRRAFVLGTAIGMLPCTVMYAFIGYDIDRLLARGGSLTGHELLQTRVLLPFAGLALLALASVFVRRFREWKAPRVATRS
jgi:uncharacterized membrane protein YdjX (TVP38/TMEM64 family)